MADQEIEQLITLNRFSHASSASYILLALYLPFGLALGLVRIFIFLLAYLLLFILPNSWPFKRAILRLLLTVAGVYTTTQGLLKTSEKTKVLIANHISSLDPFILAVLCPNIVIFEGSDMSETQLKLSETFRLPADKSQSAVLILKEKIREKEDAFLFFPEKIKTNGKSSLLKFSHLPFEVDYPVQPITLQMTRLPFSVSGSTYSSTVYEDLLWCLVLPLTMFTIKYLPVIERKKEESLENFIDRVQSRMAKSLGLTTSLLSHYDVTDYVKRKSSIQKEVRNKKETQATTKQAEPKTSLIDSELEKMVKQVKEVLPDAPLEIIIMDLKKSKDVDTTITNILEGRVEHSKSDQTTGSLLNTTPGLSFKASNFEANASARQLSFAERKKAMLEEARLRYRLKHGL